MGAAASAQRTVRRGQVYILDSMDRRRKRRLRPAEAKWDGVSSSAEELRAGIVQHTVRTLPALKADTRATRKVLRHRHARRVQAHARAQSRIKQLEALRKRLAFATAASVELEFGLRPGTEVVQACDKLDTYLGPSRGYEKRDRKLQQAIAASKGKEQAWLREVGLALGRAALRASRCARALPRYATTCTNFKPQHRRTLRKPRR